MKMIIMMMMMIIMMMMMMMIMLMLQVSEDHRGLPHLLRDEVTDLNTQDAPRLPPLLLPHRGNKTVSGLTFHIRFWCSCRG